MLYRRRRLGMGPQKRGGPIDEGESDYRPHTAKPVAAYRREGKAATIASVFHSNSQMMETRSCAGPAKQRAPLARSERSLHPPHFATLRSSYNGLAPFHPGF